MGTPTTSQYHFRFCPMIIANECKYDNRSSSERDTERGTERDTERLRYGYPNWYRRRSKMTTEHNHRDLTAMEITAERLQMEIKWEDYREPNLIKPLLEMFTEWHAEGSRNYGRTVYQTESRITLPEAYQMTTKKPTDILPKLPTETRTKKSTTKLTKKSTKSTKIHWSTGATGISLRQKTFIGGEGSEGEDHKKRSPEMTTGKYHRKKITGKDHARSEKSTKISTKMPTELPTEKQSTEMSTKKSTGRSPMLCSELHHWEASTSQCQLPMTTDMSDTTRRLRILYEACGSTVPGLGRAQAHTNTWWV